MILGGVHIQFPHKPLHLLEGGGAFGGFYEGVGRRVRDAFQFQTPVE